MSENDVGYGKLGGGPSAGLSPNWMSERELLKRALGILHRMGTERVGWRAFFFRWYYSDEPLRNDAANLVREAQFKMKMPLGTQLVGHAREGE